MSASTAMLIVINDDGTFVRTQDGPKRVPVDMSSLVVELSRGVPLNELAVQQIPQHPPGTYALVRLMYTDTSDEVHRAHVNPNALTADGRAYQDSGVDESHAAENVGQPQYDKERGDTNVVSEGVDGRTYSGRDNWSAAATLLLISTYADLRPKFSDPRIKKKNIWDEVAVAMSGHKFNFTAMDCSKKWSNLELRYKKILDNKGPKKSGRGAKMWEFFDKMDDVIGNRASSVSLRDLQQKPSFVPPPPATVRQRPLSASAISPSSDTDDDDVLGGEINSIRDNFGSGSKTVSGSESGSAKGSGSGSVVIRKKRKVVEKAPEWFVEAEHRMQEDRRDWQQELRKRMDRQESQQAQRIALLKQTNDLLKSLVDASLKRNEL